MAVTLTAEQLRAALRLDDSTEEQAEVERLLVYATEAVSRHLAGAYATTPDSVANEAVVRLAAYLFDQPNAGRGSSYANAMRNSGAGRILLPYVIHRAGAAEANGEAATPTIGSAENPVIGVDWVAEGLEITFADGSTVVRSGGVLRWPRV